MKLRPRLGEHALLRRHVIDGVERIAVHHSGSGALVLIEPRACDIALLADGTRDRDGIALAASRAGYFARQSEIDSLLDGLDQAGLLVDGIECGPLGSSPITPLAGALADVPVEVLPGYRFECSGAGACCRQYASIALGADDVSRARSAFATLPGDTAARKVTLPLYGGLDSGRQAMTLVDGDCLQLLPSRRCGIQERAGYEAKPSACRAYPATFVFDGVRVRVSTSVECDCVLQSLERTSGAPLSTATRVSELSSGISIRELPLSIRLTDEQEVERARYLEISDEIGAAARGRPAIERAVALAAALAGGASSGDLASALLPRVQALATSMEAAASAANLWRSKSDRTRRMRQQVAVASKALLARGLAATLAVDPRPEAETFALDAALFGHQLAGGAPVAEALLDLAARLLVAREMSISGGSELGDPITVVMAATRGATTLAP